MASLHPPVKSAGDVGNRLRSLIDRPAYHQSLKGDRSTPASHLGQVLEQQQAIDGWSVAVDADDDGDDELLAALWAIGAANRGYGALLCGCFSPAPVLSELVALDAAALARRLASLSPLPVVNDALEDACALSRQTLEHLVDEALAAAH